jgi:hypothetical protein
MARRGRLPCRVVASELKDQARAVASLGTRPGASTRAGAGAVSGFPPGAANQAKIKAAKRMNATTIMAMTS